MFLCPSDQARTWHSRLMGASALSAQVGLRDHPDLRLMHIDGAAAETGVSLFLQIPQWQ